MLNAQTTHQWVRDEITCRAARSIKNPVQKLWYLTMREISAKSSSEEFIKWLENENLTENYSKYIKILDEKEYVIEAIYGEFILAEEELSVRVKRLWGTLRIPGATRVFVDDCNGTIYQSDQAHVRIKESNLRCKQRPY